MIPVIRGSPPPYHHRANIVSSHPLLVSTPCDDSFISPLSASSYPPQEFKAEDGAELFGEEAAEAAAAAAAADLDRRRAVPGLLNPYQEGMDDL